MKLYALTTLILNRASRPASLSAEKSRARFFAPLRCAQNDSMASECADVTLSSAI